MVDVVVLLQGASALTIGTPKLTYVRTVTCPLVAHMCHLHTHIPLAEWCRQWLTNESHGAGRRGEGHAPARHLATSPSMHARLDRLDSPPFPCSPSRPSGDHRPSPTHCRSSPSTWAQATVHQCHSCPPVGGAPLYDCPARLLFCSCLHPEIVNREWSNTVAPSSNCVAHVTSAHLRRRGGGLSPPTAEGPFFPRHVRPGTARFPHPVIKPATSHTRPVSRNPTMQQE
jgi:hypothetical protein